MDVHQPKLGLSLRVAQKQILTPGLVQMVTVLALNRLELREMINEELVANPVLEEMTDAAPVAEEVREKAEAEAVPTATNGDAAPPEKQDAFEQVDFGSFFDDYLDPGFKSPAAEPLERPSFENFLSRPTSLADHLEWQLNLSLCPEPVREAAYSIIGNLNEDGYLTATIDEIAQSGNHTPEDVEGALTLVQSLDPPGVAARDLRECLLLELKVLAPENRLAERIVSEHLDKLQNRQYKEIARALDRPQPAVERALALIRTLDPRPGQRYNVSEPRAIEPDVAIVKVGDEYKVLMNEDGMPQLRLSHRYRRMLQEDGTSRDVRNYVKERFNSALQLLKNIEQRKQTIMRVCQVIVERQREFLDKGDDYLRPMMIKEVAEVVGVHPSTVSRAVGNKYAETPQGVRELRSFFSEAVQGPAGSALPLVSLKRAVKRMIEEEDSARPLTDDHITLRLHQMGISVTRRTVAKYREDMQIPSTHHRRRKS
ncbi:MAG TPA: RNA polymerase factor sigma-54 [Terriglobia bacterium]|nr:RNA polymerase factor sigma-54 [Terriglobia bacterium]